MLNAIFNVATKSACRRLVQMLCQTDSSREGSPRHPDFIANAGGVICASVEYHGGTQNQAFETIEEKIRTNTDQVLEHARKTGMLPRQSAVLLAEERVKRAMVYRR